MNEVKGKKVQFLPAVTYMSHNFFSKVVNV